jgi:hypothetical protein
MIHLLGSENSYRLSKPLHLTQDNRVRELSHALIVKALSLSFAYEMPTKCLD